MAQIKHFHDILGWAVTKKRTAHTAYDGVN